MAPTAVRLHMVTDEAGQRLDNFLFAQFRSLPRSRVYRMVRGGEVRINGSRAKFHTRLKAGDKVRVFDGPMAGISGIVQEKNSNNRALILMELLGRPTTVELDALNLQRTA